MISRRTWLARALLAGGPLARQRQALARNDMASARNAMVREIEQDTAATGAYSGHLRLSSAVLEAMRKVPRHHFVPPELAPRAYENRPLPIGHGQTISQPFIVALMTELAQPKPTDRVLEVGTGSGYQAAVLAQLVARVYTIEIVAPLGERAANLLRELGYTNVEVRVGDGYAGWAEAAPFDAVIVTAAPDHVPQPLVDQLRSGGRLVIPVGPQGGAQQLVVLSKRADGSIEQREALPVRFVPLTRKR